VIKYELTIFNAELEQIEDLKKFQEDLKALCKKYNYNPFQMLLNKYMIVEDESEEMIVSP
jgi:membrane protein insertase Oxa1/YidC/SpoIIIJ